MEMSMLLDSDDCTCHDTCDGGQRISLRVVHVYSFDEFIAVRAPLALYKKVIAMHAG
jgi:hypothetical protein